jgi:hypothetical protein
VKCQLLGACLTVCYPRLVALAYLRWEFLTAPLRLGLPFFLSTFPFDISFAHASTVQYAPHVRMITP